MLPSIDHTETDVDVMDTYLRNVHNRIYNSPKLDNPDIHQQ
jgi:hypothetical protein